MMDAAKRFAKLQRDAAVARTERDKAQGALDRVRAELLDEFDVKTVKAAKRLLRRLEAEADEKELELEQGLDAFERKWKGADA